MDPENFENWRIYPSQGDLPMVMDNIRCEEREYDITRCRHDGINHNIAASCAATEVVGLFLYLFLHQGYAFFIIRRESWDFFKMLNAERSAECGMRNAEWNAECGVDGMTYTVLF